MKACSNDMGFMTASEMARAIREKRISSRRLVMDHLQKLGGCPREAGGLGDLRPFQSVHLASLADEALAAGDLWGPLHGVPVTADGALYGTHTATAFADSTAKRPFPQENSPLTDPIKKAGAIVVGNIHGASRSHRIQGDMFGPCKDSFGGAAAVASGTSPLHLGADLGGDLLFQAHSWGVFAMKPTRGRVTLQGLGASDSGWRGIVEEQGSPVFLGRSVQDLSLAARAIANIRELETPQKPERHISYKLAWMDRLGGYAVTPETSRLIEALADRLSAGGIFMKKASPEMKVIKSAWDCWALLYGYQLGQRATWRERQFMKLKFRRNTRNHFGKKIAKGLRLRFIPYARAMQTRKYLISRMNDFFNRYDFLILPVALGPACHAAEGNNSIWSGRKKIPRLPFYLPFTTPFCLTGHPVIVIPLGKTQKGLPVGIQIAGPLGSEANLLEAAAFLSGFTFGKTDPTSVESDFFYIR